MTDAEWNVRFDSALAETRRQWALTCAEIRRESDGWRICAAAGWIAFFALAIVGALAGGCK